MGQPLRQDTPEAGKGPALRRILVVDDDSVIATTLAQVFKANGFDAIPLTDPLLALVAARRQEPIF